MVDAQSETLLGRRARALALQDWIEAAGLKRRPVPRGRTRRRARRSLCRCPRGAGVGSGCRGSR
jgi:hypothetical protein